MQEFMNAQQQMALDMMQKNSLSLKFCVSQKV